MVRTKGEPGTGNVVEAVRHMRAVTDRDRAGSSGFARSSSSTPPRSSQAPYELVKWVARERQAAGRELLGGRHRDAGRRGAHDAARLRRRVRRQRHLQERRPVQAREGHRRGDHALRGRRRSSRGSRATWARRWSASTSPTFPRASACRSGAGSVRIGVLALQGAFREHVYALEALDVRRRRGPPARSSSTSCDGLIIPGGESTAISQAHGERTASTSRSPRGTPQGMAVWGTCAGAILIAKRVFDGIAGPARPRADGHRGAPERVRPTGGLVRGRPGLRAPRRGVPRRVHPCSVDRERVGEGVEVLAEHEGHIVAARQGDLLATTFHPELTGDPRVHRYFVEQVVGVVAA